ncbi:DUF4783 domain-containing protein [Mangrovibacterium lignilyticum]|uniref:DUF4783 domain-containing protein n=1 Tax=Mangrovibacterium lignilyticum TaxID=2668052 RepID=UPI0013D35C19|nr:DUF4783 domain-containing protein [Mangrovibacterium lignilyticum]
MKRNFIKTLLVSLAFVLTGYLGMAQIPDELILSFKTGNASTLSSYFNQNIELFVVDQDDVYSRAQAQQIVSNFFNQNKASGFSIIHQSGKEDTKYAIGKLTTNKGVYRVSFLVKNDKGKPVIHQLRIEKQ